MNTLRTLSLSWLGLALASSARANLLLNGGMEKDASTPINPYNLVYVSPALNSTALPGWAITSGSVDIVPNSYFQASQGGYSIDMVGTPGLGTIQQSVTTIATTPYTLNFDLSANPESGPLGETGTTKRLLIQALAADGTTVLALQQFQINDGTRTLLNMQWSPNSFNFTATGSTTTLRISALTPLNLPAGATSANVQTGPVIDNLDLIVSVGAQGPEPASLGLLGVGVFALLLLRRRYRVSLR